MAVVLALLVVQIIYASGVILGKFLLPIVPAPVIVTLRMVVATVAFFTAHRLIKGTVPRSGGDWARFALLGVLPASVLFYTHQHIAYGGTFGQYYLEGAIPYLSTLGEYWATTIILLVSYASIWRAAGEIVVWTAALAGRAAAAGARRAVEIACGLAYFGGVPALLALRYLA